MNVTLTPELEKLVRDKLERGDYQSSDALVREAVHRLIEEEEAERGQLQRAIQQGIDSHERGDYAEYDELTIQDLARDVHERGLKRLAGRSQPTTGE